MKCTCTISGLEWQAEYMSAATGQPHPFFSLANKKIPAILSLWQAQKLSPPETHLLFTRMLLDTEHVSFSHPLLLSPELLAIENAQMEALAKLAYSGCFQKENIQLPAFLVSKQNQDISQLIGVWEEELEAYRVSYMIAKQQHEIRAMLTRVKRAFANPLAKGRKQIITAWMLKCCTLPEFNLIHPISNQKITCKAYWIELLHKAIDGDHMISYPEKDIVEFKEHLEEHLPLNYAQEFSILEELRQAIHRKQNYFGYSFVDADERSYAIEQVKPKLRREDFPNLSAFLQALKQSRNHSSKGI